MSIRAMNWAWAQELPPTPKLILMALADAANDRDECWPGIPFIARKCCVSERTVQRVLQDFDATKLMSIEPQFDRRNGRRTSNKYRLNITPEAYPDNLSPLRQSKETAGGGLSGSMVSGPVTYVGDIAVSPPEPQHESEQQPLHIPNALSKLERQGVTSLARALPREDAQALLDELADALETATIRTNAMRWFRGLVTKYRKGQFVATGGVRVAARRARQEESSSVIPETTSRPTDPATAKQALAQIKGFIGSHHPTAHTTSVNHTKE
ncbi:helix-turn-helix domain-containing protein [Massilia solisilvae]|uniref:Helix-turn-helix domain-containing protein n=1 Tax=Massilia solisilvae TaxID=1811225 RepID=A0ABT2BNH7_9BURK|nr:helix-turn-helix domain-containing protein [Massilia solisilvae]MCS0610061.1 helix-turn-helix domain-containing protein [Massilia solisilvae]